MKKLNTRVLLASRPDGWVTTDNFRIVEEPIATPREGEFLVASKFLSLDPYMRGRMNDAKSYAPKVELGHLMIGSAVGEVVESKHQAFAVGDWVIGQFGWQSFAISNGTGVRVIDAKKIPPTAYLGVAGMPGVTAHVGLYRFGEPKSGDTVVISAAAGAVGSVVGQLARLRGARAVGIAGGADKCEHVVRELEFDACVDYKSSDFPARFAEATAQGVDVLFENVGGAILDACLGRLNPFARIALCGLVSQYNLKEPYGIKEFGSLLVNRVRLSGFIVSDHMDAWPLALEELANLVADKKLQYRETIASGLREAPAAFIGMLSGKNLGKQLVALD
jgi:NADPH-dependent curcumin reductase